MAQPMPPQANAPMPPQNMAGGASTTPEEKPVKEITLCVYADGSYGVKTEGKEQKYGSLDDAIDAINTQAGGGNDEAGEGEQAAFDQGASEVAGGGGPSRMGAY